MLKTAARKVSESVSRKISAYGPDNGQTLEDSRLAFERQMSAPKMLADQKKLRECRQHSDWVTVRLFIASTFKDFRNERQAIMEQLYPKLFEFCLDRKIFLFIEDLYTGKRDDFTDQDVIYLYLDTLEQCYRDNYSPFYLHLLGESTGFIPDINHVSNEVIDQFGLVRGLSLMETSMIIGAYRLSSNPNALFLARDSKFLSAIPFHQTQFTDEGKWRKRINLIKEHVEKTAPKDNYATYTVQAEGIKDVHYQHVTFKNLDKFIKKIEEHFKHRIDQQYKYMALELVTDNKLRSSFEMHKGVADHLVAKTPAGTFIMEYVDKLYSSVVAGAQILLLSGECGSGKSTILSHLIAKLDIDPTTRSTHLRNQFLDKQYKVFYHFSKKLPMENQMRRMHGRILGEMFGDNQIPAKSADLLSAVLARFLDEKGSPMLLIIDDIDEMESKHPLAFLPSKLPNHLKLILSANKDRQFTKALRHASATKAEYVKIQYMIKEDAKHLITTNLRYVPRSTYFTVDDADYRPKTANNRPATAYTRRLVADELVNLAPMPRRQSNVSTISTGMSNSQSFDSSNGRKPSLMEAGMQRIRRMSRIVELDASQSYADDKPRKAEFTPIKCITLAHMLKNHTALEKVKAMSYFSTTSVAEAELLEFESDSKGHLVIALLCLLEVSRSGLRELELRQLLANESKLLPDFIRRKGIPTGFTFNFSDITYNGQLAQYRWRYTILKIRHHIDIVGNAGENRLMVNNTAVRRAIQKRYLSKNEARRFFELKLATYFERDLSHLEDRAGDEAAYHLKNLGEKKRLTRHISKWSVVNALFDEVHSEELIGYWTELGDITRMQSAYMDLALNFGNQLKKTQLTADVVVERLRKIALLLSQAGLYTPATKTLQKALEMAQNVPEDSSTADAMVLGRLFYAQGEIHHQKHCKSNELFTWVGWDELSRIPVIISAYDNALKQLKLCEQKTTDVKRLTANCYRRLAFWYYHKVKLNSPSASDKQMHEGDRANRDRFMTALKTATAAKEMFTELGDPLGAAKCSITLAQCQAHPEKADEILKKSAEKLKSAGGDFHPQLLKLYAVGVESVRSRASEYEQLLATLNTQLHHTADKQRYGRISELLQALTANAKGGTFKEVV